MHICNVYMIQLELPSYIMKLIKLRQSTVVIIINTYPYPTSFGINEIFGYYSY